MKMCLSENPFREDQSHEDPSQEDPPCENPSPEDSFFQDPFEVHVGGKETHDEILVKQADVLGERFDYDASVLTSEQRAAVFKKYWAIHLNLIGLKSPRHYKGISPCVSVPENTWPGVVAYLKADKIKRGYIEPEDLMERLRQLKPSNNFELCTYYHPQSASESPTSLDEEGFEISAPDPDWFLDQIYDVNHMERKFGPRITRQYREEIQAKWATVQSSVELLPLPNSHLLRDMGHSPGGTRFPKDLIKGLVAIRDRADKQGMKFYDDEYDRVMGQRKMVISRWKERNPGSVLAKDPLSIYRTWPKDLIDELDELDRGAIRCGRKNYVALLKEAEKKMQTLVAFWVDCGLLTGERISPSSRWNDPVANLNRSPDSRHWEDYYATMIEPDSFIDQDKTLQTIGTPP